MSTDKRHRRRESNDFPFVRKMEGKARRIAKEFEDEIDGVKPWYSYAELFEGQAVRVFVGLNPGGTSKSEKRDKQHNKRVYGEPEYCAWLDEKWERRGGKGIYPCGESPLQERAHRAFKIMYGKDNWNNILRNTPSFNVIPFRTRRGKELPPNAWKVAMPWFIGVLEELKPELIICNGSGESMSAWAALISHPEYDISVRKNVVTRRRKSDGVAMAHLRVGRIKTKPLKGTMVLALPHLATFGGSDLFGKLKRLRNSDKRLFV